MSKEDFNLSEKERYLGTGRSEDDCIFKKKDVKKFVRLLKKDIMETGLVNDLSKLRILSYIDRIAGDKLK